MPQLSGNEPILGLNILYLIACENIDVNTLPDMTNTSSRRNLLC
jgi:hypothetical protein